MARHRLALLDMYDGIANQGMRAIRHILDSFSDEIEYREYDVRGANELPTLDYDIYISSGGPGDPRQGNGVWYERWQNLIDDIRKHNENTHETSCKKHVFFICHSFQMACQHFNLGSITKRQVTSFGIYPCHKTVAGKKDVLLNDLDDPYTVVDSRDWQLIQPKLKVFKDQGATILSLEKLRTHLEYERAIMAVRFSTEMVGTQFHPEADPYGMKKHFEKPENKETILKNYSLRKYNAMMKGLEDPHRIERTHQTIIPAFLNTALNSLNSQNAKVA